MEALKGGFRLQVGEDIYDWSLEGRMRQFQERLQQLRSRRSEQVIPLMREAVENWTPAAAPRRSGTVLTVGDEIATVSGLAHAAYGEILLFSSGVKGMVQDLQARRGRLRPLRRQRLISEGSIVRRTGSTAGMPVGEGFLGPRRRRARRAHRRQGRDSGRGLPPDRNRRPPASSTASRSTPRWRPAFCDRLDVPDRPRPA